MLRHSLPALALFAFACAAPQEPVAGESNPEWDFTGGNFNVLLGTRLLDDETWDPIDEQATWGLQLDIGGPEDWLRWDIGLYYSRDDTGRPTAPGTFAVGADTWEGTLGALTVFNLGRSRVHPYLGLGASLIYTDAKFSSGNVVFRDDDFSIGGYVRAGFRFEFRKRQHVGLDVRRLIGTDSDFGGLDTDVDATLVSLVFGYAF